MRFKKLFLVLGLLSTIAIVSCGKEDPYNDKEHMNELYTMELNYHEKILGITKNQRIALATKYGSNRYSVGTSILSYELYSYADKDGGISEYATSSYKEDYEIEVIEITSSLEDKHKIPADYIINGDKNRETVVLVHGEEQNRRDNPKITKMFLDMGYNVLQFDNRSSGNNKAKMVTFGALEQYDLMDCIKYVREETKEKIHVYGYSYGASAVLKAMSIFSNQSYVSTIIVDCPLVSAWEAMEGGIKNNCPASYYPIAKTSVDCIMEGLIGIGVEAMDARSYAKDIKTPFVMFSSSVDKKVKYDSQKEVFDLIGSNLKYQYISSTASHGEMYTRHEQEYKNIVKDALKGIFKA